MDVIDEKEVQKLAALARISVTPERTEQLAKDLGTILRYVEDLKQVQTDGLSEVAQVTGLTNVFRADEKVDQTVDPQQILSQVPEVKDGYIKVKAIFE